MITPCTKKTQGSKQGYKPFLGTDGLRVPEDGLGIDALLDAEQLLVQLVAVVQGVRVGGAEARVDVVEVGAEGRVGHLLRQGVVEAVEELVRAGGQGGADVGADPVLRHPQALAVAVAGEGEVLGVDGAAGPAVQVDDRVPRRGRALALGDDVREVGLEGVVGQGRCFGHRDGLGEEVLVQRVARLGRGERVGAAELEEEVDPAERFGGGGGGRGQAAEEFGLDARLEVVEGAPVGAGQREAGAVHVHAHAADLGVDDGGVLGGRLDVLEDGGRLGRVVKHAGQAVREVDDAGRRLMSLEVEGGDNAEGVGGTTESLDVRLVYVLRADRITLK